MLFRESRTRGSDGGTAQAPGNGARRAGGRWTWRTAHWGPMVGGMTGRGERMGMGCVDRGRLNQSGRRGLRATCTNAMMARCACGQGESSSLVLVN